MFQRSTKTTILAVSTDDSRECTTVLEFCRASKHVNHVNMLASRDGRYHILVNVPERQKDRVKRQIANLMALVQEER